MRLLLDTHVLLWSLATPEELSPGARAAIADGTNQVFASAASFWEIAIKAAAGKLTVADDLLDAADAAGFSSLPIVPSDALRAGALPSLHGDPFDRMLVAQALERSLTVVTRDRRFDGYGALTLAA